MKLAVVIIAILLFAQLLLDILLVASVRERYDNLVTLCAKVPQADCSFLVYQRKQP